MSEKLKFSIGVDLSELERGLDKASASIKSFADKNKEKFEKVGKSMVEIGDRFKFISLAALGFGAAAIKMASDFTESMNKVDVAFGTSATIIKDFAKTSLNMFGIAEGTALDMAALFGDMATSMGLPQQQAAMMSKSLVGLAGDLASFKNIDIRQAMTALNGVFTGETESLKMLGIVMTEANLQQFALTQGITKNTQEMTQAEKVQLRYAYILENTKNAQGDFARTGGGAANQMRIFTERLKEISTQLGMILLPYFTKLITYVNGLVKGFQAMNPVVQKVIVIVGLLVAAFTPFMVIVGSIITFMPQIIAGFAALTGPIGLVVLGVVALTAAIVANWDAVKRWAQDTINYFIKLYNNSIVFRAGIESVILIFKNLFEVVKFVFGSIYSIITTVFSNIYEYLKGVAKLIYAVLTFDVAEIKKGLSETIGAIRSNVSGMLTELTEKSKTLFKSISENQAKAINNVLQGELKEVNFSVSKESTKKLETAVTNAVTAGVENGLGGTGGTSAVQSGTAPMTPKGIAGQPTNAITSDLSQLSIPVAKSLTEMEMNLYDFNERVSEFIQGSLVDTFSGIGDAIGNALATGTNVAQAIGQTLLKSMGSFLSSLGKQMIAFGTTALFFDKTKKSLFTGVGTPAAAAGLIAAGIALSAIGSAIASSASSGGVGGGGGGASQSYSQAGSTSSSSFSAQSNNEVVFRIAGNDLLGVLRRAEGNEQRLG
jgi:hypothetical protein